MHARRAAQLAAVTGAYVASGKLGLDLAYATSSVTAIWAPTGIALAALVLGGPGMWPAVAAGALLTNAWTGVPPLTVLGITAGNTLEAVAGAALLRRAGFRPSLERMRDLLSLVVLGAVVSTTVSATVGVTSLLAGDAVTASALPSVWRTWWLGDMGGDLIVAQLLLVAATHRPFTRAPGRALEAGALAVAVAGTSILIFSQHTNLVYLVFPLMIWSALRFWQPGAAGASLLLAVVAVVFTARGHGPFATSSPDDRLILAQTLVAVAGITAMVLAVTTSQRQRTERALREISGILQESLLPAALPELPRLECAGYFRPAGEGHRVGGDFYDVFEAGDGSWGLAVGDVCGKGVRAAALTALARYTLRAAALYERDPSRILGSLNDAVCRHYDPSEFCTALYARLDVVGSSPKLTLASGGHPLPLVLRADGTVEQLGTPGTLLGADPSPLLVDESIDLAPGETVLFYTDGLIDAYAPEHLVQVGDVEAVLRSCTGRTPDEILGMLARSLLNEPGLEPRDDVAMVVLQAVSDRPAARPRARRRRPARMRAGG